MFGILACVQHRMLIDSSAEIIKIEHPVRGDDTRAWGPPYAEYQDERDGNGESAYYLSVSLELCSSFAISITTTLTDPTGKPE